MASSSIAQIGYNPEMRVLHVTFTSHGQKYRFENVPRSVYEAFRAAKSQGAFYHKHLRGRYQAT
jgi:KTSC domain-containing protein